MRHFEQTIAPLECTSQLIDDGLTVTQQLVPDSCTEVARLTSSDQQLLLASTPVALGMTLPLQDSIQPAYPPSKIRIEEPFEHSGDTTAFLLVLFFVFLFLLFSSYRRHRQRRNNS